jgi:hypothetical protein
LDELNAEVSRVEGDADQMSPLERQSKIDQLRNGMAAMGVQQTSGDEAVFALWAEGVLDSRHLADHLGARMYEAGKKDDEGVS